MKRVFGSMACVGIAAFLATAAGAQTVVFQGAVPNVGANCRAGDSGFVFLFDDGARIGINLADSLNCGDGSFAQTERATAVGADANAATTNSSAFGFDARATGQDSTALGAGSRATAPGATAVGAGAVASHTNSTALGVGATTSASNQVTLGGSGSSVRLGDIAASTAAQTGPTHVVTVDANGTLGRAPSVFPAIAGLQAGQLALDDRIDTLFDLRDVDRREARRGTAAAIAMGQAPMPSAPGRMSYVFNVAQFRGEAAAGGSIMYRLGGERPFAISAAFSLAGGNNNAMRVGVAGEF